MKPKTLTKTGYKERIAYHLYLADTWLLGAGYDAVTDEQHSTAMDPATSEDAIGMVEHWQVRCGLPAHITDKLVSLLRGFGEDYGS